MPMTVRTGGGASPALGWAHPSSGEAFAEPLEPPGVPSALNPAEQMALSHAQRHRAREGRVLPSATGRREKPWGLLVFVQRRLRGPAYPGDTLRRGHGTARAELPAEGLPRAPLPPRSGSPGSRLRAPAAAQQRLCASAGLDWPRKRLSAK